MTGQAIEREVTEAGLQLAVDEAAVLPEGRDGPASAGLVRVPGVEQPADGAALAPDGTVLDLRDEHPEVTLGLTPGRRPDGPGQLPPPTRRRVDDAHDQLPARPSGPDPLAQRPSDARSARRRVTS